MAAVGSKCPTKSCCAADSPQVAVDQSALASVGVNGPWTKSAFQCTHCQCVYSRDAKGHAQIRGYLDNVILGMGWSKIHA